MTNFGHFNHQLGLRHLPSAYVDFTTLAYNRFADPDTLVFVDTNVLGLPFRFHEQARAGFFSLLKIALDQKRLFVPAWASNEFFHNAFKTGSGAQHGFRLSTDSVRKLPTREEVLGMLGKLASDEAIGNASRVLGVDKHEALSRIAAIGAEWNNAVAGIGVDLDADKIHGEIIDVFKDCFLPLDFNRHSTALEEHADRRRANRIPPGLTDGAKGDKAKRGQSAGNVDGDLALWLEILDRAEQLRPVSPHGTSAIPYQCVIVLTEERKEDFCYAPRFRLPEPGSRRPGAAPNDKPRILLPDPRLVSEFEARVGHRHIAFLNVETLAHGWQTINGRAPGGDQIRAFARALMQQMDVDSQSPGDQPDERSDPLLCATAAPEGGAGTVTGTPITPATLAQSPSSELGIPEDAASNEKAYTEAIADLVGMDMVRDLNMSNWYVQNPAVQELLKRGIPDHPGVAFLLGRSLLQAAHGNVWRADMYIKRFEETAVEGNDQQQALLAGLAYEALFDGAGQRRVDPKSRNLHHVLEVLCKDRWTKARTWVLNKMDGAVGQWYWRPCAPVPELTVRLDGREQGQNLELSHIRIEADGRPARDVLSPRQAGEQDVDGVTLDELIEWIADHTLVPPGRIRVVPDTYVKLRLPDHLTFDPLTFHRP